MSFAGTSFWIVCSEGKQKDTNLGSRLVCFLASSGRVSQCVGSPQISGSELTERGEAGQSQGLLFSRGSNDGNNATFGLIRPWGSIAGSFPSICRAFFRIEKSSAAPNFVFLGVLAA